MAKVGRRHKFQLHCAVQLPVAGQYAPQALPSPNLSHITLRCFLAHQRALLGIANASLDPDEGTYVGKCFLVQESRQVRGRSEERWTSTSSPTLWLLLGSPRAGDRSPGAYISSEDASLPISPPTDGAPGRPATDVPQSPLGHPLQERTDHHEDPAAAGSSDAAFCSPRSNAW
jgi:hypothetical protein